MNCPECNVELSKENGKVFCKICGYVAESKEEPKKVEKVDFDIEGFNGYKGLIELSKTKKNEKQG